MGRKLYVAWFRSATGVSINPMSSPFLQNRRNLILLSVGAFVVLVSTIGGIIFAVSVGSKPAQPEGLTTSSSDGNNQAGTQVFWTQVFNNNNAEPEESSSSSSASSSASLSPSSSRSIEKEKKEVAAPVQKSPTKKGKKGPVLEKEDNDDSTTVTKPPGSKTTPSKTRIIVIAVVVSVLVLLTIAAALLYLFFFHWAPQPIPDPEPVPEPVQEPELEQPKELAQSTLTSIGVFSFLLTVIFYVWLRRTQIMRDLVLEFGPIMILIRILLAAAFLRVISMVLKAFLHAIFIDGLGPIDFLLMFLKAWAESN